MTPRARSDAIQPALENRGKVEEVHRRNERQSLCTRDLLLRHEHVLCFISFAQKPDDASCVPVADQTFQREPLQRPTSLLEEVLA